MGIKKSSNNRSFVNSVANFKPWGESGSVENGVEKGGEREARHQKDAQTSRKVNATMLSHTALRGSPRGNHRSAKAKRRERVGASDCPEGPNGKTQEGGKE